VLLAIALVWFVDSKLDDYYTENLQAEIKAASDKANALATARDLANEKRRNEALNAKNIQLEKNADSAKRADDAAIGLRDDLRASNDRAKTSLASCIQHADTLSGLFVAIDDFAGKVAVAANGHAADAVACHQAWPR
jgi:hypothetical protein